MKLAMILGKKQGEGIKPRLQNIKDNLDIDVFDDVAEFVYNVSKRNTIYDRILVLSTKITPASLEELNTCWGMYSKETAVIMLSRKGADEAKAKAFLDAFKTPVACAMLVTNTTVQIIAESVLRPTGELNADYGYKDFLAVEIDEDEYVPPPPPEPTPPPQPVQQEQPKQRGRDRRNRQPKPKKKGGGFLGGIFGSRGSFDDEEEQAPEQMQADQQIQPQAQQPMQPPVQQSMQQPVQQPMQQPVQPMQQASMVVPPQVQSQPVQQQSQPTWDESEWETASADVTSDMQSDGAVDDFDDDFGSDIEEYEDSIPQAPSMPRAADASWSQPVPQQPMSQPVQRQQPPVQPRQPMSSPVQNPNAFGGQSSSVADVVFDETFGDDFGQDITPTQDAATADVDFGSDGTLPHAQPTSHGGQRRPVSAEQADENFGDMSIAADEAKYRQQKEAPKVITKTVHAPMLGSGSALKGVISGRMKKVVIVTGDRATGLTSTALSLAHALAKHVEVLYFDCDVMNHGLLNYIDYADFQNYEQTHMEGVRVCKSSMVFDRCIVPIAENLGILTSDFSCECSDEDLQQAAQVVAERAPDFGVVVVDCPVDKLHCVTDLLMTGQVVICVEGSKRGFMNMLCRLESSTTPVRFKRNMVSRGTMFVTKTSPKVDMKRLLAYIKSIYEPDGGVDWLSLPVVPFSGKVNDHLLNQVLEG